MNRTKGEEYIRLFPSLSLHFYCSCHLVLMAGGPVCPAPVSFLMRQLMRRPIVPVTVLTRRRRRCTKWSLILVRARNLIRPWDLRVAPIGVIHVFTDQAVAIHVISHMEVRPHSINRPALMLVDVARNVPHTVMKALLTVSGRCRVGSSKDEVVAEPADGDTGDGMVQMVEVVVDPGLDLIEAECFAAVDYDTKFAPHLAALVMEVLRLVAKPSRVPVMPIGAGGSCSCAGCTRSLRENR